MSFLEKIRKKPEKTKKKILLISTIITIILLIIGFYFSLKYNLSNIDFSNIPRPNFERDYFKEMRKKLEGEKKNLKELEEKIKEGEKNIQNSVPETPSPPSTPNPEITSTPLSQPTQK